MEVEVEARRVGGEGNGRVGERIWGGARPDDNDPHLVDRQAEARQRGLGGKDGGEDHAPLPGPGAARPDGVAARGGRQRQRQGGERAQSTPDRPDPTW